VVGILGKKVGMTQIFVEDGKLVPVTVIQAGPCWVVQKKDKARDGYDAIQIGFETVKESKLSKAERGHLKKASVGPARHLRELRDLGEGYEVGQEIRVDVFKAGDMVVVTGTSKGKGFAGVVKRHGFKGGAGSHGSMFHRAPGSIGASSYPSRVFKGMRMAGHMGQDRTTVKNLKVVRVDRERNILIVKGAVPGSPAGILMIVNEKSGAKSA
jgi:large subunit ribosomal protein L3